MEPGELVLLQEKGVGCRLSLGSDVQHVEQVRRCLTADVGYIYNDALRDRIAKLRIGHSLGLTPTRTGRAMQVDEGLQ